MHASPTPGQSAAPPRVSPLRSTRPGDAVLSEEAVDRESREMADITARLKHMDDLEIDIQVLYPTIFLRPFTRRPDVELGVTRSYNRWLIDIWEKAPERLRWVAVLPLLSLAVQVTVVGPSGNVLPEDGAQSRLGLGSTASVAVA